MINYPPSPNPTTSTTSTSSTTTTTVGPELVDTGSTVSQPLAVGSITLLVGALIYLIARRRTGSDRAARMSGRDRAVSDGAK